MAQFILRIMKNGQPLVGAQVLIDGVVTNWKTTDQDGKITGNMPAGQKRCPNILVKSADMEAGIHGFEIDDNGNHTLEL